jgi:hypothetical protein
MSFDGVHLPLTRNRGRLCYLTQHQAESWYFSQKAVTVQGGYGALFAVMVQILLSITSVAVQV